MMTGPPIKLVTKDDDSIFDEEMGRCSLNPTDYELVQGIIVAKDCHSKGMDGKGNILELKIRIKVESD